MGEVSQEKTNQKIALFTVMTEKWMISGALGNIALKSSRGGDGCLLVFFFFVHIPGASRLSRSMTKFQAVVSTLARGHKETKVDRCDE